MSDSDEVVILEAELSDEIIEKLTVARDHMPRDQRGEDFDSWLEEHSPWIIFLGVEGYTILMRQTDTDAILALTPIANEQRAMYGELMDRLLVEPSLLTTVGDGNEGVVDGFLMHVGLRATLDQPDLYDALLHILREHHALNGGDDER